MFFSYTSFKDNYKIPLNKSKVFNAESQFGLFKISINGSSVFSLYITRERNSFKTYKKKFYILMK